MDEVERYRTHIIIDYASELGLPVSDVAFQIPVVERDADIVALSPRTFQSIILSVTPKNIDSLSEMLISLSGITRRINIMKQSIYSWSQEDVNQYCSNLELFHLFCNEKNLHPSINVFDCKRNITQQQCRAGRDNFTLAPNGTFYACPAFYYYDTAANLGDLKHGLTVIEAPLYTLEKAVPCKECKNNGCIRCVFSNKLENGTLNVASTMQCKIAEREANLKDAIMGGD